MFYTKVTTGEAVDGLSFALAEVRAVVEVEIGETSFEEALKHLKTQFYQNVIKKRICLH